LGQHFTFLSRILLPEAILTVPSRLKLTVASLTATRTPRCSGGRPNRGSGRLASSRPRVFCATSQLRCANLQALFRWREENGLFLLLVDQRVVASRSATGSIFSFDCPLTIADSSANSPGTHGATQSASACRTFRLTSAAVTCRFRDA